MVKEIKKWLTEDGVEFNTLEEANNHEKKFGFETNISNLIFEEFGNEFGEFSHFSYEQMEDVIELITKKRPKDIFAIMKKFYETDK